MNEWWWSSVGTFLYTCPQHINKLTKGWDIKFLLIINCYKKLTIPCLLPSSSMISLLNLFLDQDFFIKSFDPMFALNMPSGFISRAWGPSPKNFYFYLLIIFVFLNIYSTKFIIFYSCAIKNYKIYLCPFLKI